MAVQKHIEIICTYKNLTFFDKSNTILMKYNLTQDLFWYIILSQYWSTGRRLLLKKAILLSSAKKHDSISAHFWRMSSDILLIVLTHLTRNVSLNCPTSENLKLLHLLNYIHRCKTYYRIYCNKCPQALWLYTKYRYNLLFSFVVIGKHGLV